MYIAYLGSINTALGHRKEISWVAILAYFFFSKVTWQARICLWHFVTIQPESKWISINWAFHPPMGSPTPLGIYLCFVLLHNRVTVKQIDATYLFTISPDHFFSFVFQNFKYLIFFLAFFFSFSSTLDHMRVKLSMPSPLKVYTNCASTFMYTPREGLCQKFFLCLKTCEIWKVEFLTFVFFFFCWMVGVNMEVNSVL